MQSTFGRCFPLKSGRDLMELLYSAFHSFGKPELGEKNLTLQFNFIIFTGFFPVLSPILVFLLFFPSQIAHWQHFLYKHTPMCSDISEDGLTWFAEARARLLYSSLSVPRCPELRRDELHPAAILMPNSPDSRVLDDLLGIWTVSTAQGK